MEVIGMVGDLRREAASVQGDHGGAARLVIREGERLRISAPISYPIFNIARRWQCVAMIKPKSRNEALMPVHNI